MSIEFDDSKDDVTVRFNNQATRDMQSESSSRGIVNLIKKFSGGLITTDKVSIIVVFVLIGVMVLISFYFLIGRNQVNIPTSQRPHFNGHLR